MRTRQEDQKIDLIIKLFEDGSLVRNPEYQRGEAWKLSQKAGFIDSIFREYPVPAIFLHEVTKSSFSGEVKKYDIVDGQQRILALHGYIRCKYPVPNVLDEKSKLRIPDSLRALPAPWSKKTYDELDATLKSNFDNSKISIFFIEDVKHPDEIRDLFIRLQSGTALTRQQIRDAWPGNIGPFVEALAGKLDRHPQKQIFRIVDKRGQGSETDTDRDQFAADRQTCAQMLAIFLARQRDAYAWPGVAANDLDALYHKNTQFDTRGIDAELFREVLDWSAEVFERASRDSNKRKFRRAELFAVMMLVQDLRRAPLIRFDQNTVRKISSALVSLTPVSGRATSKVGIRNQYEALRRATDPKGIIELDPTRAFTEQQKKQIREKGNGLCGICQENVEIGDEEFDHFPVPHRDGGRTAVENGRLVHVHCHPRGRPVDDEDE